MKFDKNFTLTAGFEKLRRELQNGPGHLKSIAPRNRHAVIEDENMLFDFTKTHLTPAILQRMTEILEELDFAWQREALFSGEKINPTENRPALHTALRFSRDEYPAGLPQTVWQYIEKSGEEIKQWSRRFRKGQLTGATGKPLTAYVNIGIGGSYLGPKAVIDILQDENTADHAFLSNVDDRHLEDVLSRINWETTLFGIVSKSFGTRETLRHATVIKGILEDKFGPQGAAKHLLAVTANRQRAEAFGILPARILEMKDWTGGRFSLWSAAGIAIPMVLGYETFARLKNGAKEMDLHFYHAPLQANIPVLWALVNLFYRHFRGAASEAVIPYRERWKALTDHFQQVSMESLGKSVQRNGKPVTYPTGAIIWGGTGTNVQHSFFQLLHQGTEYVPVYFLGSAAEDTPWTGHRRELLSNMLAQADALAFGQEADNPFNRFDGDRPSLTWIFARTTPENTGRLLAAWEHKVFTESVFWNINAFDQPGVELGKKLALGYYEAFQKGEKRDNTIYKFIQKRH